MSIFTNNSTTSLATAVKPTKCDGKLDCDWDMFCVDNVCKELQDSFTECSSDFSCGTDLSKCCSGITLTVGALGITKTLYESPTYCMDEDIVETLNTLTESITEYASFGLVTLSVECATKYRLLVIILVPLIVVIIAIIVIVRCMRAKKMKQL